MDEPMHTPAAVPNERSTLRAGMAFVSENLESFGFVSDACPAVTDKWLIAANGRDVAAGAASFAYPVMGGVESLYDGIYHDLLTPDATLTDLLAHTFGKGSERCEHPAARYVAALAVCTALRTLSDAPADASRETLIGFLDHSLPAALAALRDRFCAEGLTARDPDLYAASLAACRVRATGGGSYILDPLMAGDYRLYLLDSNGLRPLCQGDGRIISPDGAVSCGGKRIRLSHPAPCALLLLSESACAVNAAEQQSMKDNPGLIWRYRMRLESNLLRILTACVKEEEFGERAGRFFMGRANGRESASGAMMILRGDTPFSSFRADCLSRLRRLEDMIALLPDGYDPATVPRLPTRTETEMAYIRRLLSQEQGLSARTADALAALALHRLHHPEETSPPPPEDVPDYRRLLPSDVADAFRIYDAENDEDYACIRQNTASLREHMADHWVTLRPLLRTVLQDPNAPSDARADRAYEAVLRLNARLGALLEARRACLEQAAQMLDEQSAILRMQGKDWLHARAGGHHAAAWADDAADKITETLSSFANAYEQTEQRYRALLTAYLSEREALFAADVRHPDGAFAADWQLICDGALPAERWVAFRAAIESGTEGDTYTDLWDDLHVISLGSGVRYARIRSRAADARMARNIAARSEFRVAALRGAAYQDPDWGDGVAALLDAAHRNSYFTMVRRWQETCELMARQAAAYEEYKTLYE